MFDDRDLSCRDCGSLFKFTAGEQAFFSNKGLSNEPKRCPNCRLLLRMQRSGQSTENVSQVVCADCGVNAMVPFKPRGHRPVFCSPCRKKKQYAEAAAATSPAAQNRELLAV